MDPNWNKATKAPSNKAPSAQQKSQESAKSENQSIDQKNANRIDDL